jgi:hypothetical protein
LSQVCPSLIGDSTVTHQRTPALVTAAKARRATLAIMPPIYRLHRDLTLRDADRQRNQTMDDPI